MASDLELTTAKQTDLIKTGTLDDIVKALYVYDDQDKPDEQQVNLLAGLMTFRARIDNLTYERFMYLNELADSWMKASRGHSYMTILKTRCQHCGRSKNQPGRCRAWMLTYLNHLWDLINRELTGQRVPTKAEALADL